MKEERKKPDNYAILGLSASASQTEIKEAYRNLSLEFHPDRLGTASAGVRKLAEDKQKDINGAYEILGNPEKRRAYDAALAQSTKQAEQERAEEKARRDKEEKTIRIRDLYERGDFKGAVSEAESLFENHPEDEDCQSQFAALLYEWAKQLAEKGRLREAEIQLQRAAENTLDEEQKSQIRADLELLRSKKREVPPSYTEPRPRTTRSSSSSASRPTPTPTPSPPPPPPVFTAKQKRKIVLVTLLIAAMVAFFFEGRSLYRSYVANTTLSFGVTVDGKDLPAGSTPEIQVDGNPFSVGNQIGFGRHELKVNLKDVEPFSEHFWVFGAKNLGPLPLESSKGSLSVTVNPYPATVELKRDGVLVRQGKAPLKMDKLSVGSYAMIVYHGDYSETYAITIHRAQNTKGQIDLDLGSADLSASPPDADYDLSGNGRHWQGKLPVKLPEVPGGSYSLTVTRKGWPLTKIVSISRTNLTKDTTEFPYGTIAVTSDPPGMAVSTSDVDLGKTPTTLRELKPGQYVVSVSDGMNDQVSVVAVGPRENAAHHFIFHYGTVQISSTPPGATVIRKGKNVGTTPLTLEQVPTATTAVTLRLDNFATVNLPIHSESGFTTNFAVKLFSNRYVAALDAARQSLAANEFDSARQSVATASAIDPTEPAPPALLAEINRQAEIWRQEQVEAARLAAEAKARRIAAELAAIPALNPENIIQSCWHTPGKSDPAFSKPVSIEAGKQNPVALPVWIATDVIVKGIEVIAWPFHKSQKEPRFDQGYFVNKYQNNYYRYFGKITSVDAKNNTITFDAGGKSKQSFVVTTHFQNETSPTGPVLKPGSPVWVSGQLIALVEANPANRLFLDNCTIYSNTILPASN